jgi:hypothetical protein
MLASPVMRSSAQERAFVAVACIAFFGCHGKPKALSHEEAIAETKARCSAFERTNASGTLTCDQVAEQVESIAESFAQVSNKGKVPDDDEKALETCMGELAAHAPRCKDNARFKASLDRLVSAAMR